MVENIILLILSHNCVYVTELMQVILRQKRILRSSAFSFPVGEMVHLLKLLNTTVHRFVALLAHALDDEGRSCFSPKSMSVHEVHVVFLFINLDSKYICIKSSAFSNPWLLDIHLTSRNSGEE